MRTGSPVCVRPRRLCRLLPLLGLALAWPAWATTTTTLASSATTLAHGTALTLTATVTSGGTNVHPGTVTFCDATMTLCQDVAVIGRAQLTSTGVATYKFTPGLGSHTYKAIYAGTTTYPGSTSASVTVSVTGLMTTATTLTSAGSAGNYTLTASVAATGNLAGPTGAVNFRDTTNSNYALGSANLGSTTVTQSFTGSGGSAISTPKQGTVADFNGDGIPDIAIVAQGSNGVSILLGNGSGAFTATAASPIATGTTPVGAVAADLNGDGKMDLVVTNYGASTITILLGNGNGTFQTPVSMAVNAQPEAIVAADLNHDGNIDLVIAHNAGNTVSVLLGSGTGTFPTTISVATGAGPYSLALADFDGDGNLDIAAGNSGASTVTILLGDGTGNFNQASGSPVAAGSQPSSVVAADLNNDGKVDLVVADGGASTLSVLLGAGNGTFGTATTVPAGTSTKYLVAMDYNADGKLDILSAENGGTLSFYTGNGDGTFQTRTTSATGGSGLNWVLEGDFDGDGLPDFCVLIQSLGIPGFGLDRITHTATAALPSVSVPGGGSHTVSAVYAGDSNDATSTSGTVSLTASKVATTLTLQGAPTTSTYGQQVVLTATLNPYSAGAETTNTETVTFLSAGTSIGTGTLSSGVATLNTTTLPVGTSSLTASYPTDTNFLASTTTTVSYVVSKATPTITWASPTSISYGTALSSTQLNASSGGVAGTFTYSPVSGTVLGVGANQALSVSFTPSSPANYNSATANNSITVTQASSTLLLATSTTPSTYGVAVTFTASLPSGATGTVTFKDGSTTLGTGTITGGSATLTTSTLAVGSHNITGTWPGDTNYTGSTSSALTQTVSRAAVSIAASTSLNPASFGDAVHFTIQFSGSGAATPSGTATLQDGSTTIATLTLNGSGVATYASSALTAGAHTLHIIYNGDTNYI